MILPKLLVISFALIICFSCPEIFSIFVKKKE